MSKTNRCGTEIQLTELQLIRHPGTRVHRASEASRMGAFLPAVKPKPSRMSAATHPMRLPPGVNRWTDIVSLRGFVQARGRLLSPAGAANRNKQSASFPNSSPEAAVAVPATFSTLRARPRRAVLSTASIFTRGWSERPLLPLSLVPPPLFAPRG